VRIGTIYSQSGGVWAWHLSFIYWYCRNILSYGNYLYQW